MKAKSYQAIDVVILLSVSFGVFLAVGTVVWEVTASDETAWIFGVPSGLAALVIMRKYLPSSRSYITSIRSYIKNDDIPIELYGIAEEEISSGNIDKGLWAKALVNVKGSEERRKAEYIKLRAEALRKENKAQESISPR